MDRQNKYDQLYVDEKATARQRRLMAKFEVKPYATEFRAMYIFVFTCGIIFQLASLATAVTLPASWVNDIFHNWGIGFLVGGIIVLLLEIFKRLVLSKAFKNFFQFRKKLLLMVAVIPSIASIVFSVLGTPIMITEFGALPHLKNIAIQKDTATVSALGAQIARLQAEKDQYFEDNKKSNDFGGYRLSSRYMPTYNGMIETIATLQKQKTDAEKTAKAEQTNQVNAAIQHNKEVMKEDATGKQNAGMILGGITFGLELLFIIALAWCERYDFKEALYVHSQSKKKVSGEKSGKSDEKYTDSQEKVNDSDSGSTSSDSQTNGSDRNRIGFMVSEGTIKINEHGTHVVAYEKEKGGVSWYRKGQLTSQITEAEKIADGWIKKGDPDRAQPYLERSKRLKDLKKKLTKQIEKG